MLDLINRFGDYIQAVVDFSSVTYNTAPYLYLVAVLAILYSYSKYTVRYLSTNNNNKSSSFISYQFVFSVILTQCIYLVFCVEGSKQQVGAIVWIIYVSALMVLFLIFLALTIAESFFSITKDNKTSSSSYQYDSCPNSGPFITTVSTFGNLSLYLAITCLSYLISYEIHTISSESLFDLSLSNSAYYYSTCNTGRSSLIDSTPIFNTVKRDIVNSLSHYALSGLLQAATLLVVVLGLIH